MVKNSVVSEKDNFAILNNMRQVIYVDIEQAINVMFVPPKSPVFGFSAIL